MEKGQPASYSQVVEIGGGALILPMNPKGFPTKKTTGV